jgi:hypothetical protein
MNSSEIYSAGYSTASSYPPRRDLAEEESQAGGFLTGAKAAAKGIKKVVLHDARNVKRKAPHDTQELAASLSVSSPHAAKVGRPAPLTKCSFESS